MVSFDLPLALKFVLLIFEVFQMDFSALLDGLQWTLDEGCNLLQNPFLPSFQLDVDASVPTRTEDAPEWDLLDLDLGFASFASTSEFSVYSQLQRVAWWTWRMPAMGLAFHHPQRHLPITW